MGKNFVKLSVNEIGIDPLYQRELDDGRVDAMAKDFDLARIGVPVVSMRKSGYVVLDGQHRVEAMRRSGHHDKILCEVHNGLSIQQESALFLKLNNGRKEVQIYDKYRARMVAEESVAVSFTGIVKSLGLRIGRAPGKNTICALRSIESVYRRGSGNLELTLAVLKDWGRGESSVFDGDLIKDVSRFLVDHGDIDVDGFSKNLSRHDPGHVLRRIRALREALNRNRRLAANSVFREIYNHKRKGGRLGPVEATLEN